MNDWTIIKILFWTESYFKDHSIDSPRLTAEILLALCLHIKRIDLYLQHDRPLQKNELSTFKNLIKRRVQNEPVAYITGEKGFFDSTFDVEKGVLIPRPDTETIVEQALKILSAGEGKQKSNTVLELGTGSGAIILSLAKAAPGHLYFSCDISRKALAVAGKNAKKILSANMVNQVFFFAGDWFTSVKKNFQFDLILSNPPYIPSGDIGGLQPEIRIFEPLSALDGGKDGLDCFRIILKNAHNYLVSGGTILLETGFDQKEEIKDIVNLYPQYASMDFIKDMSGHDRVAIIKKSID